MSLLPGHRLIRLTVLDFGLFDVGPGLRRIGIPGYLFEVEGPCGSLVRILFDTGFPPGYVTDFAATAARDGLERFGAFAEFGPGNTAEGQLALLDLTASDISHVILSHGHIDHVGSLPLFAHARILLTATERADPRPCYFFDVRPMDWPEAAYLTITAETVLCDGLTLIPTPGHTAGHLSVLAELPEGRAALLAADAINRASEAAEGFADARDPQAAARSAARLREICGRTGATLIYGHDPAQWPTLPKAPLPWG